MKKIMFLMIALLVWIFVLNTYAQDVDTAISKLSDQNTRQEAIKEIEQIGVPTLPKLQEIAKDANKPQEERITAIVLLGRVGNKTEEKSSLRNEVRNALQDILKNDEDKFSREASAIGLGYLLDKEAIPQLQEALNDQSGNVKMRSAWALAKLEDNSGKELALVSIKGKDVTAQLLAIEVLEAIGDKSVINALDQNVNNPNSSTWTKINSQLAIKRLEIIGLNGTDKLTFLKETLNDTQFEINEWAAQELAKEVTQKTPNGPQALEILKQTANDQKIAGSYPAEKMLNMLKQMGIIASGK